MKNKKSIAYLFKSGRINRITNDEYPVEFFYGYMYIKNKNKNANIIDVTKLGVSGPMNILMTGLTITSMYLTGLHIAVIFRLLNKKIRDQLNKHDVLITTTTSLGTGIALLHLIGVIKPKPIFIIMGLGDLLERKPRRYILQKILKKTIVFSISKGEINYIKNVLHKNINIKYLPFGIDNKYWEPEIGVSSDYVLSIGNDRNRDYELLLSIWKSDYPELKIITKHDIKSTLKNVTVIQGDWNEQILSDEQIRMYIKKANFIVIPVRQTSQPSGQSFCLQSMSCGKAVVMSNIIGLWDEEVMIDQDNCLLYEPGNDRSLMHCVEKLFKENEFKIKLGLKARELVERKYNSDITGMTILSYLNKELAC